MWTGYKTAAWLVTQLSEADGSTAAGKYQQAVDQYAVWKIFLDAAHTDAYNASVNAAGGALFASAIASAYSAAVGAVANGYTPDNWSVVTPDPRGLPGSAQEFLTPASVPELSTVWLLLTVLAGIALDVDYPAADGVCT